MIKKSFAKSSCVVFLCSFGTLLTACGASGSGGGAGTTTDTVITEAKIEFLASEQRIKITERGPTVRSESIQPCEIGFDADQLSYQLINDNTLKLADEELSFKETVNATKSVTGVPDRLFAIWSLPTSTVQSVSFDIEVEIQPELIIYRNTCTSS